MPKFVVAVARLHSNDWGLDLHFVTAPTWQEAFNRSPSTWWGIPEDQDIETAWEEAEKKYGCLIAVKEIV